MSRYIDVDVVTDFLINTAFGKCEFCNNYKVCQLYHSRKGTHKNCWRVKQFPIANVKKVRHGEWKEDEETGCLQCSECGYFTDEILGDFICADEKTADALNIPKGAVIHRSMHPFYCSRCGAKMDGGEK